MNISSAVVKTLPENLAAVRAALLASGLCEIHFADDLGRIVISIEGDNDADESSKLKLIADLPGVASADFAFTYRDEEAP
jgi:nitrate reductase NapD